MLHYIKLDRFATDKHSSLLDQFISYKENEVLWMQYQVAKDNQNFFEMKGYVDCKGTYTCWNERLSWLQKELILDYTTLLCCSLNEGLLVLAQK